MSYPISSPLAAHPTWELRLLSTPDAVPNACEAMPVIEARRRWRLPRRSAKLVSGPRRPATRPMWKAIQEFLGPVPAPVFILIFVAGLTLSIIASAPTRWVEHGLSALARRRSKRKPLRTPTAKS